MKKTYKKTVLILVFFFLILIPPLNAQVFNHTAHEYFKKSLECMMNGDYQEAIVNCNEVLRRDPNSAVTYVIRGRAYYEIKEYDKAINDCNQAIRRDRNNATAYTIRGSAHNKKGDIDSAFSDWQTALNINPFDEEAKLNVEQMLKQPALRQPALRQPALRQPQTQR